MQLPLLPARRGLRWLIEGFLLFRRKPALLCFLLLGYWLTMAVVLAIPVLGQVLSFVLVPAFSVSLMNACRLIERGETAPPQLLFSGFHSHFPTLLRLGSIYLALAVVIAALSALFDGGVLFRLFVLGDAIPREALQQSGVFNALVLMALLFVPVMMAYWFAPVLVAWHRFPAGKALFFSLVAGVRNWRAIGVYSLAVAMIAGFFPRLLGGLVSAGGAGAAAPALLTLAFALMFVPTLYASFYVGYRDLFGGMSADE